jgi:DNA-directed RNA polymerase specialized sigma24 family protein
MKLHFYMIRMDLSSYRRFMTNTMTDYIIIRRLMDPDEDADDVAHEVYLRLIRHRKNHDLRPSFALIRTIAMNILTDRFRKRRSQSADKHIPLEKVELVSPPNPRPRRSFGPAKHLSCIGLGA